LGASGALFEIVIVCSALSPPQQNFELYQFVDLPIAAIGAARWVDNGRESR
jgi:hypothetical protein